MSSFIGKHAEDDYNKLNPSPTLTPSITPSPTTFPEVKGATTIKDVQVFTFEKKDNKFGMFRQETDGFYCNIPTENDLLNEKFFQESNQKYDVVWLDAPFEKFMNFSIKSDILVRNYYKNDYSSIYTVIDDNINSLRKSSLSFDLVYGIPIYPKIAEHHSDFAIRFFDKEISFLPTDSSNPPIVVPLELKPTIENDDGFDTTNYFINNITVFFETEDKPSNIRGLSAVYVYALLDQLNLTYKLQSYKKITPIPSADKMIPFLNCFNSSPNNYPNCLSTNKKIIRIKTQGINERLQELVEKDSERLEDRKRYIGFGIKKGKCIKFKSTPIISPIYEKNTPTPKP